jgi:DNA-binding transcriptional regulator YiaG
MKAPTPEQVIKLRKQSGLTAAAFGALVYVDGAAVYSWEAGRRGCPLTTWELLLIYFGRANPRILKQA